MSNPARQLETTERSLCPVCNRRLTMRGTCQYNPQHTRRQEPTNDTQPQPESGLNMKTDQQSLTGLMWDAYEVPAVKVGLSGSLDLPMDILAALDLNELSPGDNVVLTVGATVRMAALGLDAKDNTQGRISLRLETIRGAQVVQPC